MATRAATAVPEFEDDAPVFEAAPEHDAEIVAGLIEDRESDRAEVAAWEGRSLQVVPQPQQHLVVGLAALASMDETEFQEKLDLLTQGQKRLQQIVDRLLKPGEDYGKVPGISRPFLHQPGAEKLQNFYGYAVRQEADRVAGDGATTPPLAYHVRSYVHLGSFDGPVVGMGYGEANSWEEKYRWRQGKPTCPKCGREGLVKGRAEGPLKGRWWCPGREGGCNSKFEPGDIPPPGKVENTDPWSLAETLIQMASKRSFVSAIRRATGTSGYFTQDEDSPSVRAQSAESDEPPPPEEVEVKVGPAPAEVTTQRGGRTDQINEVQLSAIVAAAKEKKLSSGTWVGLFERLFGLSVREDKGAISAAIRSLSGEQAGVLLTAIETGVVA